MDTDMDVVAGPSAGADTEITTAVRAVRMRSKSRKRKSKRGRSKSKKKSKSKSRSRKLKRKRSKSSKRSRSKKRKSSKRRSRSKSRKSRGRRSKSKSKGRKKGRSASKKRLSRSKSRKSKSKRRVTKRRRSASKKRRLSRVAAQAPAAPITKRRRRKAEDIDNMLISQVRLVPKELKSESLKLYMKKMLHKQNPKLSMKGDTMKMIDSLMKNCMDHIANQASEKIGKNRKTLTAKCMAKAIHKVLPKTWRKTVDAKGNDALRQFARASGN